MTSSEHAGERNQPPKATSPDGGHVLTEYLVLRAQDGRPEAMDLLVRHWHAQLLAHAKRLTGRTDAAEDAVQEAWLAVTRGIGRLRDPERFAGWAYGIVTRQCALWLRRHRRRRQVEPQVQTLPEPLAPTTDQPQELEALQQALCRLDPADTAILHLRYTQDLRLEQIAEAMNMPVGTVKSRLFHARARLRTLLETNRPPNSSMPLKGNHDDQCIQPRRPA